MAADKLYETELALKAVDGLLESVVLSPATRRHVMELKARLESELTELTRERKDKFRCA
jgi:hypothetical protein